MEQFEQLLTCAICLDRYRNPKLLPCQHSFCMEPCMDGLVDYVRRQVKCPECRAEHRIPYQGVQAFPTNVTLQRFLELHIEITGELPDPTSGQTMERCGVCSEKSYCALCVHCEKKCCPECKDAHMDILRREITRINSQIRRGLHRLQDALALVEKNTLGLQTNCASVAEEVDEIYRRLSKALKDRTEHLRNEVDRYLGTELRGLIQLKENLELEIANIQSNCDLAEAHINENVPWDDSELLDTKELFLRTVEFIRNFEYEAGDYSRRVRFVMAHDPNQLVLHVAGYGELNIKPETGTGLLLGSSSTLAPPGGSPGLMRSKSDHRLASQYRQQEEDRLARNRYLPEYEYDAPEYEAPRNKSRYRSRFMRHRDGDDSDGDSRSTVRFTSTPQESAGLRERVLDTEDAARGPLSGIFRLTDSPRVMKKLQECERAVKRKKEEPASQPAQQPQPPKPQVQVRKVPTAMARQTSEDDEISRIKKQNKTAATPTETVEERQPAAPAPVLPPPRETPQEREAEDPTRRPTIARRTSTDTHTPATRSASSDSSTGSESSGGSGIRSTGAPFTAEEMKQKYLSRAPPTNTTTTVTSGSPVASSPARDSTNTTPGSRPFQSRFLGKGNRAAPPPPTQQPPTPREEPAVKKKEEEEEEDEETSSSSEETESETEEESENEGHPSGTTTSTATSTPPERHRSDSAMARTDIGPLLARSAEARRGSKEDSPSTRYSSPRGSPAQSVTSPTTTTTTTTASGGATLTAPGGYTSRTFSYGDGETSIDRSEDNDIAAMNAANDTIDSAERAYMVRTQSSDRVEKNTDVCNTDNDETVTSSSSPSVNRPENIDAPVKPRTRVERGGHESAALVEGRSVNDVNSLLRPRDGETRSPTDYAAPGSRTHEEDDGIVRKTATNEPRRDSASRSTVNDFETSSGDDGTYGGSRTTREETEREARDGSMDTETNSASDGESGTESDEESDEEVSRDENSNVKSKKTEKPEEEGKRDEEEGAGREAKEDVGDGSRESDTEDDEDEDEDDETTVLSVRSNPRSETSSSLDRANDSSRRRSSSIIGEKSIEELFDDNGWVITDQDLQAENPQRISRSFKPIGGPIDPARGSSHGEGSSREMREGRGRETSSGDVCTDVESDGGSTTSRTSEGLPRSRVYRQSSIGKNGWMVSDESESESERPASPVEATENEEESRTRSGTAKDGDSNDKVSQETRREEDERRKGAGKEGTRGKDGTVIDKAWSIDENGWVILNKLVKEGAQGAGDVEDRGADETSTIRSQTTDLLARTNVENGALVARATGQSKETEKSYDEHEVTPAVDISIPMQMVTTVFCVSVLCYSVLINLFL